MKLRDMALRYLALTASMSDLENQWNEIDDKVKEKRNDLTTLEAEIGQRVCDVGQTKAVLTNGKVLIVSVPVEGQTEIKITSLEILDASDQE